VVISEGFATMYYITSLMMLSDDDMHILAQICAALASISNYSGKIKF